MLAEPPRLAVADLPRLAELIVDQVNHDPQAAQRQELVRYYLYSLEPGASLAKFLDECHRLIALNRTITAEQGGWGE